LLEAFEQVLHFAGTRDQEGIGHGVDGGFAKGQHVVVQRVVVKGHGFTGSMDLQLSVHADHAVLKALAASLWGCSFTQ
jgi:hypothetical protein